MELDGAEKRGNVKDGGDKKRGRGAGGDTAPVCVVCVTTWSHYGRAQRRKIKGGLDFTEDVTRVRLGKQSGTKVNKLKVGGGK